MKCRKRFSLIFYRLEATNLTLFQLAKVTFYKGDLYKTFSVGKCKGLVKVTFTSPLINLDGPIFNSLDFI